MISHQRNTEKGRGGMPLKAFLMKNDCFMQKNEALNSISACKSGF
jgi:hypothetical protein